MAAKVTLTAVTLLSCGRLSGWDCTSAIMKVVNQYSSAQEGLRRLIVARLVKAKCVEGSSSGLECLK